MRVIEFEGKKAYLTEEQWKSLLKRYNPEEEYEPCILCINSGTCCKGCPVSIFETEEIVGCEVLARGLLGLSLNLCFNIAFLAPLAKKDYAYEAVAIYEWLRKLPKKK